MDWPWPDAHYDEFKGFFQSGQFVEAHRSAIVSAVQAGRLYRDLDKPEDQFHRAIFYGLAAVAADKAESSSDLVNAFFMARLVLKDMQSIRGAAGGYEVTLRGLEESLAGLGEKVRAMGIDPAMEPRVILKTRMAMHQSESGR